MPCRPSVTRLGGISQGAYARNFSESALASFVFDALLLKDRAESWFIIDQPEPVLTGKFLDFSLAIFQVYRPDALQLIFVDGAVAILAGLQSQFAFD